MRIIGKDQFNFGDFEFRKLLDNAWPLVVSFVTVYGAQLVGVIKDAESWKAAVIGVGVLALRAAYLYWADNTHRQMSEQTHY